jgi:hypothetical protein
MTGEELYAIQIQVAGAFGEQLPLWVELCSAERVSWEERAYEQELRDRKVTREYDTA